MKTGIAPLCMIGETVVGKPRGNRDDFVALAHAAVRGKFVRRERAQRDEVSGGTGVDEQTRPNAQRRRQLGLEGFALRPEGQPEI